MVAVLATACSAVKLAYNSADRILFRYIDEYLDLTAAQKEFLNRELEVRLTEHRMEELPRIVAFLDTLAIYASDGLNQTEIRVLMDSIVDLYATSTRKTIELVGPVLAELSAAQLRHLTGKIAEANEDYAREYLDPPAEVRKRRRAQRTLKRLRRWTGALSDDQVATIVRLSNALPDMSQPWYDYRVAQQRSFLAMLGRHPTVGEVEAFLESWWIEQHGAGERFDAVIDEFWTATGTMIRVVDGTLSTEQRRHALRRLARIRKDLRELLEED